MSLGRRKGARIFVCLANLALAGLALCVASSSAWAAYANCAAGSPYFNLTTPAIGTTTTTGTLNDPNDSATAGGCDTTTFQFNNFQTTDTFTSSGTGTTHSEGPDPTLNGIYIDAPVTAAGADGPGIEFRTTATGDTTQNWDISATGGGGAASTADYLSDTLAYGVTLLSGSADSVYLSTSWGTITVTNGSTTASSLTATVELLVCPGTTTFTVGCTGEKTLTLTATSADSGDTLIGAISFGSTYYTSFGIEDIITLDGTAGHGATEGVVDATLDSFTDDFAAPEPSSLVLLGTALAGIGILRFRKRRV